MRKETDSLRLEVCQTEKTEGFYFPWGHASVSVLLLAGLSMLLTENFPSISFPWWVLLIAVSILGMILLGLYSTKVGKWIFPAGFAIILLGCFLLRKQVCDGFCIPANDGLAILTAETGRIFLEFTISDSGNLLWFLVPFLMACTILITRSVWKGSLIMLLPILLPVYILVLAGWIPCDVAVSFLIIGTILLLIQHRGNKNAGKKQQTGFPVHLLLAVLCMGICFLAGMQTVGRLDTDVLGKIQDKIHEIRYDRDTNTMPEGQLKNLSSWKKSNTPALEVTMEKPEKMYLRGQIYEVYTGISWEPAETKKMAEYSDLYYWLHQSDFYGQSQIGTAAALTGQMEPLSMTVRNLSACSAHGYYPYAVCGSSTLEEEQIGDTLLPAAENLTYLPGSVPEWYQIQNNLASEQEKESISRYLALEQAYKDYVEAFDLQLTPNSWSVLNRQLKTEEGSYAIGEIRDLIRNYLNENLNYDESVRTVNGNEDFLYYTLERSGSGYSVHYATAAVLMLRYFGVPARYVEGYFLSAEESAQYEAGETIVLTEEHAHAWAEYYVPGVGFVPFEVTPGYMDQEELELGSSDSMGENKYQGNQQKFAQVQKPEDVEEREQDRNTFSMNPNLLFLLPLLLLLVLLILVILRRIRLRKALRAIDEADDRNAIAMRYGYAVRLLGYSTMEVPQGTEEAAMLNQEALFSNHQMTKLQRQTMDDYARSVLTDCKNSWNWIQKLRYRFWDCLY